MAAPAPEANADLEPIRPLDEVLTSGGTRNRARRNNAEKKRELLESMPPDRLEDMLIAMNQRAAPATLRRRAQPQSAARSSC